MTPVAQSLTAEQLRYIFDKRERNIMAIHELQLQIKSHLESEDADLGELRALIGVQDEFIHEICADQLSEQWGRLGEIQQMDR